MLLTGLEFAGVSGTLIEQPEAAAMHGRSAFIFGAEAVLGTRFSAVVTADNHALALTAVRRAAAEIDRLDKVLNWRDPDSELGRLNKARQHTASPDLFAVVAAAEHWRAVTSGAYSGRLGHAAGLLARARGAMPDATELARLVRDAEEASVVLDDAMRRIVRPEVVRFDLDAAAKGYIVDCALDVIMASPGVEGALVDIGGDIRCAGDAPGKAAWSVGLPDPLMPFDNAPLTGRLLLRDSAIATSGFGTRGSLADGEFHGSILDPRTGRPVPHRRTASVIAGSAMDADALATALVVMPPAEGASLIRSLGGVSAHITSPDASTWVHGGPDAAGRPAAQWIPIQAQATGSASRDQAKWHEGWITLVTFTAPPRQMKRDPAFRSPYVAMWITDADNRPVRTLLLIGAIKEWQQDNYIWWGSNRARAEELLSVRSMSTRGSGIYKVFWDGVDDSGAPVPPGLYTLHVETSRERGRHTHRSMLLDFTHARHFTAEIPSNDEAGGLSLSFDKY